MIDVDRKTFEETQQLTCVQLSDFNLDNGRLSPAKGSQSKRKMVETDSQLGFKGTRLLGLSEYFLDYASPNELLEYERASGAPSTDSSMTALCSFNAPTLLDRGLHEPLIRLFEFHDEFIGKDLAWSRKP